MSRIRQHLRSNFVGYIALFFALSTGSAVALNGSNTVQSDDLGPGAQVTAPDVAPNAVNGADVTDNSLTGADVANLSSGDITDNSLTGSDVNEGSLDATQLRTRVAQGGCQPAVAGTGGMVPVGSVCIDKYEASVWSSPTGGTQYGVSEDDYPCDNNGQDCGNIFARSVPGVAPSAFITYFQAQQALANSGKRLPTNAEWQTAVAGTPDGPPCPVSGDSPVNTGSATGCISRFGANDMVGNLAEWVADWVPASTGNAAGGTACPGWGSLSDDTMCLSGASTTAEGPGVLIRGGAIATDPDSAAGPFSVGGATRPQEAGSGIGFRGAR